MHICNIAFFVLSSWKYSLTSLPNSEERKFKFTGGLYYVRILPASPAGMRLLEGNEEFGAKHGMPGSSSLRLGYCSHDSSGKSFMNSSSVIWVC